METRPRSWLTPLLVGAFTAGAVLVSLALVLSTSWLRWFPDLRRSWLGDQPLPADGELDLASVLVVPLSIVAINAFTLAAEAIEKGWAQSALRRVLFLETRSARTDLFYFLLRVSGLVHVLAYALTFGLAFLAARRIGQWLAFDVLASVDSSIVQFLVVVLVNTFVFYWAHRLMHSPWLFEIHKVHHSALELNVLTTTRNHPVDFVVMVIINSAPAAILGARPGVVAAYLLVNGLYQCAVHSEMRVLERGWIQALIVTPAAHKVHHSRDERHFGRNFGILTLWERLFGTYHPPVPDHALALGIDDADGHNTDRPVRELWGVLTRWIQRLGR